MTSDSFLSIARLCYNENRTESELLEELKPHLAADPDVVHETDRWSTTLLHEAARLRSVEFCKLIMERNPQAIRAISNVGLTLPFHYSCYENNTETAKYLFRLYPECIDVADDSGNYPIHGLLEWYTKSADISELTQFLLHHDRGAVTKPNLDGCLPLHIAVYNDRGIDIVKLVFDAHPKAIFIHTETTIFGEALTPLQFARDRPLAEVVSYFQRQLEFLRQSEEDTIPDDNGHLTIHRGLYNKELSLGAIKLMIEANPAIINAADNMGRSPLIIALNYGSNKIVKYLIEVDADSTKKSDSRRNFLLHHACLAGNCDIVNFILEKSNHGSSVRNSEGKLPIHLLLYDADCNRDSIEYVSAIHSLLLAYPNVKDIAL